LGGKTGLSIASTILISCYILLYALALGRSFGNNNSPIHWNWELIGSFMGIALLYGFLAYSSFCFNKVTRGIDGYKIKLINNADKRHWIHIFFDKKTLFNQFTTFIGKQKKYFFRN
jgi:uncharacterized membrane protein YbhN (UPF0104 family)